MSNCEKSEKSRGILAFANNTTHTDYVSIAKHTLKLASHTLNLPHTLITDQDSDWQNHRYDVDLGEYVPWKNSGRYQAYDLSPYDETIVMDVDLLLFDQNVLNIFQVPDWDVCVTRHSQSLTAPIDLRMGPHGVPFVWATLFAFRKSDRSRLFFDLVRRIQDNYGYYRALFNTQARNYRNDFAFAMAEIIMSGYQPATWHMPTVLIHVNDPVKSLEKRHQQIIVRDQQRAHVLPEVNLHVMAKAYLQSPEFFKFIEHVTT